MMEKISCYTFFSIWRIQKYIKKKIQQKFQSFKISVSHTTPPRSNEVDGVDYNFVSKEKFTRINRTKKNFMNMLKYSKIIMEHQKKMLMKKN